MSHLRSICRPNAVVSSFVCCCRIRVHIFGAKSSSRVPFSKPSLSSFPSLSSDSSDFYRSEPWLRLNHRRYVARASNWTGEKSPYDVLELERDADEDQVKVAYRRLAKYYHPDGVIGPTWNGLETRCYSNVDFIFYCQISAKVYDGRGNLEEGETAETRFIKIQAAYELLVDGEKRRNYDMENRVNPMKASEAWMEWLIKKRKAFDQRGDMAIAAWAEQQQREMNLRARQRARSKVDPEEEKRILAKEKKASVENFQTTLRRHTLVLKKRDLMRRKKAEEEKQKEIRRLLAAEGFELEDE
ncbi:uncharacterized protein LOC110688861 isoform X1 [Chenopodium quinoa]|uniref:uncharacterized protein LOC110688861 isoform X1 n=1 Tax=Chenopodium quinoa TaxID=63459 RepID=UPI000B76C801|nr:uncharacterized protein LOC110688861 isoform X1 [Chenopodium quinoa]